MTEADLRVLLVKREGEVVEFKPSLIERHEIAEYAVGIGNAGGGRLIMGVSDKIPRRILPLSIPSEDERAKIRQSVADSTDIRIEFGVVPTTDGPVLVVHIPCRPRGIPFHTKSGKYLIRLDDGLRGMTLSELDAIRAEAGVELTAAPVPGKVGDLVSAVGMEELRNLMVEAGAAHDLMKLPDMDLLRSLGVLADDGGPLVAGLLLAGKPEAIRSRLPHAQWRFLRMKSDVEYDQSADGYDCFPVALKRLRELIDANNPIVTIPRGFVHPEFPRYPVLALRELLANALAHRDYAAPGAVMVKLYPDRLEIANPGGFVGGVTPDNILHHASAPRYPALFTALARIRLANAANLGVPRVFYDFLREGKEPPSYWATGSTVRVTLKGQDARPEFIELVHRYPDLTMEHLLVLRHLTQEARLSAQQAAQLSQRPLEDARTILDELGAKWRLVEAAGSGRGRRFSLSSEAIDLLAAALAYFTRGRLRSRIARARVLAALAEGPLSNADVRQLTHMGRDQVVWLMKRLEREGLVTLDRKGRSSQWIGKPQQE